LICVNPRLDERRSAGLHLRLSVTASAAATAAASAPRSMIVACQLLLWVWLTVRALVGDVVHPRRV
jgi:hypothetical protein